MPAGIGIGQVVGLVRATRSLEDASAKIVVAGPGAAELAAELRLDGEPGAVLVDGDPAGASVAIRLLEGALPPAEESTLRALVRGDTPVVVVRRGGAGPVPYVLADYVVDLGLDEQLPLGRLAETIADASGPGAVALAARLPVLRPSVTRTLVERTALTNAVIAASPFGSEAKLPLLTLSQCRMLLSLGVSRGEVLPRDPQELALAAGPALAAALALGLAARELVRRSPVRGPLVRAAVAYGGTRALAAFGTRF